jgi:hypothetical protein
MTTVSEGSGEKDDLPSDIDELRRMEGQCERLVGYLPYNNVDDRKRLTDFGVEIARKIDSLMGEV